MTEQIQRDVRHSEFFFENRRVADQHDQSLAEDQPVVAGAQEKLEPRTVDGRCIHRCLTPFGTVKYVG